MANPSEQPHNLEHTTPTPPKDESAGKTLHDAVTEARLGGTATSAATLAPARDEVAASPRSKAMDSVVRIGLGTEAADAGRRDQIVADHFTRRPETQGRAADFVARQQGITADQVENRVRAQPMQLEAGGKTLEGQTTVGRNGKEYFFSNQGQRYEMVRGEDGYSGLRPLGRQANQDVIPIGKQPQIVSSLHGSENAPQPGTTRGVELNARPQPMNAPEGVVRPAAPGEPRPRGESGEPLRRGESGEPRPRGESGEPRPRGESGEPRPQRESGEPRESRERRELPPMTPAQIQQMREHLEANPVLKQQLRESTDPMAAQMRERLGVQPATRTDGPQQPVVPGRGADQPTPARTGDGQQTPQ
jgi:hypothetical protein